jgi:hypothetical protein
MAGHGRSMSMYTFVEVRYLWFDCRSTLTTRNHLPSVAIHGHTLSTARLYMYRHILICWCMPCPKIRPRPNRRHVLETRPP